MYSHPFFNLRLHDDAELEQLIGGRLAARQSLHEWPLSCVQRLTCADGREWIYKAQWGPSIEAQFYARARSRLLPQARTLYQADGYSCLLIEPVAGPSLAAQQPGSVDEQVRVGRELQREIAAIQGDPPVYLDIHTLEGWQAHMRATFKNLLDLSRAGCLHQLSDSQRNELEHLAFSDGLSHQIGGAGLVHGDLNPGNIFPQPEGWMVIDWQRPLYGPAALDLAILLTSAGQDARPFVDAGVLQLMRLLQIAWLAECAAHWFPAGQRTYDGQMAQLAGQLLD